MVVKVFDSYEELSAYAADLVAQQLKEKPDSVLGFPTGGTPVGMYGELCQRFAKGEIDFSRAISFNLDEYYPIKKEHSQSYDSFMRKNLFDAVNLKHSDIPNGETSNPIAECERYEAAIEGAGGIDLQILGIGRNGHIGFNEPAMRLDSKTHLTALTDNTVLANARFFDSENEVPRHALTMGLAKILQAKKILMLVSGEEKHEVLKEMMTGTVTTANPATLLNLHPDVTVLCDRSAYNPK